MTSSYFNKALLLSLFLFCLTACSSVNIDLYKDEKPKLILNEFFNGELTAHGIIKNRSGEVIRYFNVSLEGQWDEKGKGVLNEKFIFDDNSIEYRRWTFTPEVQVEERQETTQDRYEQIRYRAKANDTLEPVPVHIRGNAFFMNYNLIINYQGDDLVVNIDDKMYLINERVLINESVMSKYGIDVGYITLTILKSN